MMSGLLWIGGPAWAGQPLSCADLGDIARVAQQIRAGGAGDFERTTLARRPESLALTDGQWAALRAASRLGFYSNDAPEETEATVAALCRGGFPAD